MSSANNDMNYYTEAQGNKHWLLLRAPVEQPYPRQRRSLCNQCTKLSPPALPCRCNCSAPRPDSDEAAMDAHLRNAVGDGHESSDDTESYQSVDDSGILSSNVDDPPLPVHKSPVRPTKASATASAKVVKANKGFNGAAAASAIKSFCKRGSNISQAKVDIIRTYFEWGMINRTKQILEDRQMVCKLTGLNLLRVDVRFSNYGSIMHY